MWWLVLGQALAGCPPLELRQEVGVDHAWLRGDVATVWSAGTLWWFDPKGLRSTPAAVGKGTPLGRLGADVVWGERRDDHSSYAVTFGGRPLHGSEAWGLATLVKVKDQWWIASTRAPGAQ